MVRRLYLLVLTLALTGCAGRHESVADYDGALHYLEPASASSVHQAVLQKPEIEGFHSVEEYMQMALRRNPEIAAMERRVAARGEVPAQVMALPDPMISNMVMPFTNHSLQTASGRMPNSLTVAQQFPWFGKLRLRGEIADLETRIAWTQLAETELKVIESVKVSYYDLLFHQRALKITVENERLLRDYIKFAEVRYTAGQASQQDVLRSQVELNQLQDQIIQLNRQLRMAQADLAKLLSISPESNLRAAGAEKLPPAPEQIDQLYQAAIAARPELQGRLDAIQRDQRKVELARLEYFPDVAVGVNWGAMTTNNALARTADGIDNWGLMIGINVPIWHDKLRAGVRETQHRTSESARLYDSARDETFRQIKRLTVQAHALQQQVNLYRKDIIPQAEQTLKVSAADYRVGKVVILQLIDNWTLVLRFQIQNARLEAALAQTLASLERAVGMQLTSDAEQKEPPPNPPEEASSSVRLPVETRPERVNPTSPARPAPRPIRGVERRNQATD